MGDVELGRRAVACKAWRPVQGMTDEHGEVIVRVHDDGTVTTSQMVDASRGYDSWQELWTGRLDSSWVPDLDDPATLGAVLALVREAWGQPSVYVRPDLWMPDGSRTWAVCGLSSAVDWLGYTSEAAALIAALEAAPVRS